MLTDEECISILGKYTTDRQETHNHVPQTCKVPLTRE